MELMDEDQRVMDELRAMLAIVESMSHEENIERSTVVDLMRMRVQAQLTDEIQLLRATVDAMREQLVIIAQRIR